MSKPQRIARVHARPSGSRAVAFGSPGVPGSGAPAIGRIARPVALLALAAAMLLALLAAPAAQARQSFALQGSYNFGGEFGTSGPGMMALDEATHSLYVVDPSNNRILKFDVSDPDSPVPSNFSASATNEITEADGASLALSVNSNLAVDNSGGPQEGTIYLATNTPSESRGEAFAPSGEWLYEFRHDAEGNFDPNGTPDPAKAIGVANAGPRAGEIYRWGPAAGSSAIYTASPTPGQPPTLRRTGGPAFGLGTAQTAFFWKGGEELVTAEAGFSFSSTPRSAETLADGGYTATYQFPSGTTELTPGDIYRQMFVRRTASGGSLALIEQTGLGFLNPPRILDEFGFGEQGTGLGMVFDGPADRLYVSDASGKQINIFGPMTAPDAAMLETGYVDPTKAKLRANVDPLDLTLTECTFEWGATTFYGEKEACNPLPSGNGNVEVSTEIEVATRAKYHSRVTVKAANGTVTHSPDLEWQAPDLPEAETLPAGPRTRAGTAMLGGTVDANQTQARYYVEYSTHPDLSGSTAAPAGKDADAGNGDAPTPYFQVVEGLAPDTTYYFRLVAVTKAGADPGEIESFRTFAQPSRPEPTECANAEFRTGDSAKLPECRAWERVSPADKNGASVAQGFTVPAPDGNKVTFGSLADFAGQEELGFGTSAAYMARRENGAWETSGISPRPTVPNDEPAYALLYRWLTPDLSRMLGVQENVKLPGAEPGNNTVAYIWDDDAREVRPLVTAKESGLPGSLSLSGGLIDDSGTSGVLVGFARLPVEGGPNAEPGQESIYWWRDGSGMRLASVLPNGEPVKTPNRPVSAMVLSADGQSVIWSVESPQGRSGSRELYLSRRDGATEWISAAQGVTEPPSTHAYFEGADEDLRYIYFRSADKLTEASEAVPGSASLYRYDTATEDLEDLTAKGTGPAGVKEVLNVSKDGRSLYLVATGNLAPGAEGSGPKLYGLHDGTLRFITDYTPVESEEPTQRGYLSMSRMSTDGRYLLFPADGDLSGTRMKSIYDTGGHRMLYRYDWDSDEIVCVTCDPRGIPGSADVYLSMPTMFRPGGAGTGSIDLERYFMSDSGSVLFNTTQSLVPADINGRVDAYLWDGDLRLLTTGRSEYGEWAEAATKDFRDVYILSGRQLVPSDEDHDIDLYDARIGGGLASQQVRAQPARPSCEGSGCQGLGTSPPPAARLDTERSGGEGTPARAADKCASRRATVKRRAKAVRKHRAAVRRAHAAVRRARRRYKAAPSARVHHQVVRQQRRLRQARAKVRKLRKHERQAKAALRRCQGGGSAKDTTQARRRSGHRHAQILRRRDQGGGS